VTPTPDKSTKPLYVVTSGCYSDYGVVAIFDDRALADAYVEGSDDSAGYGMRVEEFDLNPGADRIRESLRTHYVELDRAGDLFSHSDGWMEPSEADNVTYRWRYEDGVFTRRRRYVFRATLLAKSKEQAIKAANERRARYIASGGAWPDDE
jgi:hypothetical protein